MYISARHIGIKQNQDVADFILDDGNKTIVICDGIGEFEESGKAAEIVSNAVINDIKNNVKFESRIFEYVNEIKKLGITGGTTLLLMTQISSSNIRINSLGNGRIIHLNGNFSYNPLSNYIYRFTDLLLPDISPKDGALTKHISHHSGHQELSINELEIKLNNSTGDIILLMSDGISSLEECFILKDGENRFWRNESVVLFRILDELNEFLERTTLENFQDDLISFNSAVLDKLKIEGHLEDDASLGLVITDEVLSYYKKRKV